jgi:hypothetical protein
MGTTELSSVCREMPRSVGGGCSNQCTDQRQAAETRPQARRSRRWRGNGAGQGVAACGEEDEAIGSTGRHIPRHAALSRARTPLGPPIAASATSWTA